MSSPLRALDCYIGVSSRPLQETYLEVNGISREMIMFAIPAYGVLFKCRASGDRLDLEFGAFFALLRFIKTSLAKEKIRKVRIHSSDSRLVFAIANRGGTISSRPGRRKMLEGYLRRFDVDVRLVPRSKNQAFDSPAALPSTPKEQIPPLKPRQDNSVRGRFLPIQKGLTL